MVRIPLNTGFTRSEFKFGNDTLNLTKYDDGRFEYRGIVDVPSNMGNIKIPHPIGGTFAHSAIATNYFSNSRNVFISASCDSQSVRIDAINLDGTIPVFPCAVNIFVQGFWK